MISTFNGKFFLADSNTKSSTSLNWLSNDNGHTEMAEIQKMKMIKLHLYILNADSMFYSMLSAVWKAFLLVSRKLAL